MNDMIFRSKPKQKDMLYDGSTKTIYQDDDETSIIQFFKDDIRLLDKQIVQIAGKGVINNTISAFIMEHMSTAGIENHFIEKLNMREQRVYILDIIPVQVHITNIAVGRYVTEIGIEEGYVFNKPMIDFRLKHIDYNPVVLNEQQIINFDWMTHDDLTFIKQEAYKTNAFLSGLFTGAGMRLAECILEFGRMFDGECIKYIIADEITPDTCTLWDMETNAKIGYDMTTGDIKSAIEAYQLVAKRLKIV